MGVKKIRFPKSSSIGIKPVSEEGSKRLIRAAIKYIYYLIWVRDGAVTTAPAAYAGWSDPLTRWTRFLLANPTVTDYEPKGRFFGQLVNGKITAKMHGDTFAIMKDTKHPKEAFKVVQTVLGQGGGDLFVKSHPKSNHLYVDSPLNPEGSIASTIALSISPRFPRSLIAYFSGVGTIREAETASTKRSRSSGYLPNRRKSFRARAGLR